MSFWGNVASAAIGYGISEVSKSHPVTDFINDKFGSTNNQGHKTLRDVVTEYAQAHGIYTSNNEFAHELEKLCCEYKECDYDDIY